MIILTVIEWAILAALALILVVWVVRAAIILTPASAGPRADRESCRDLPDAGLVSVIIPAKDEEANIETVLASALAQDYPHLEIIVVDDRSTDRTAEIVGRAAARDDRVRLLRVDSLSEGWCGKPHALHVGAGAARGRWLLFVDADCRLAPHAVRAGLGLLEDQRADLFSVWPAVESHTLWERVFGPVAGGILIISFRPGWVNDPRRRVAFACGQFLLLRREAYDRAGGWEAVKGEVVEDVALAHRVKAGGGRVLTSARHDLSTVRMYHTFAATFRGWTRIYYGCFRRIGRLAQILATLLVFSFGPMAAAVGGAIALASGAGGAWTAAVFALGTAALIATAVALRQTYVIMRQNPWYGLLCPVAAVVLLGVLLAALAHAAGLTTLTWRGTTYRRPFGGPKS